MNKVLRMSLLALATVALMGSCKKKSNGEPDPNGTQVTPGGNGGNNGGGNNGGGNGGTETPAAASEITLTIPAGQKFTLAGLEGENLSVGGENVTAWAYSSSAPVKKEFTSANGSVVIKGNVKTLTISAGVFTKLEVPNGLEVLRMTTGATAKELILANATSLKQLSLSESGITNTQDLSALTNLQTVYLHKSGAGLTLPKSVRTLTVSENPGVKNAFDLANFPNLETVYFIGSYFGRPVDFSGSTKLKTFGNSRSALTTINLKNCSALANVLLRDMNGTTSVDLSGCPLLKEGTVERVNSFKGFATNLNSPRLATLNLAGASLEKFDNEVCTAVNLTSLDLSGNKLAAAKFDKFTALKTLNLLNNPTLTGSSLTEALKTLPATNGTIKIAGLSASDAAIVAQRGWTVAQ